MTAEAITKALHKRPFEPFDILLPDGGTIPVRHPEYVAYSGGRIVLVFTDTDNYESIDIALITRLSIHPTPTSAVPAGTAEGD